MSYTDEEIMDIKSMVIEALKDYKMVIFLENDNLFIRIMNNKNKFMAVHFGTTKEWLAHGRLTFPILTKYNYNHNVKIIIKQLLSGLIND